MSATIRAWAVLAFLLAAFALKSTLLIPPAPVPGSAFDTDRAIGRLERILGDQRPHPVDSAASDDVRGRLISELRAIGLNPVISAEEDCSALPGFRTVSCSLTRNVVATIAADRPGKALLLNAHYDSTPTGPGAADDGIGVATLLEVAANLQQRPPAQPVILLFNEGEEFGLNGAAAFARTNPLASRVGSLINIEARGVDGPAYMFETSEPNAAALTAFAASSSRPYANSLTADAAKLIPNYTDVVIFKQAPVSRDWKVLSYAIVGNETRYHTPGDRVEWLDRSSVNHMGTQVLAAARQLPQAAGTGQRAYADIAGRYLVQLPLVIAEITVGLLLGLALFLALRSRAIGRPLLACAAAVGAGVAVAVALAWLGTALRAGDYWRATPAVAYMALYAACLAAMAATLRALGQRSTIDRLRAAGWLLILIVGAALSVMVHGAIIYFLIAPAIALAGLLLHGRARTGLIWVAACVQLVMLVELMASLEVLLIDGPLWATAPLAALVALPFLVEISFLPLRRPAIALAVIATGLWVGSLAMPRASEARPAAFTLSYVRDDAAKNAHWAVASKQAPLPDDWGALGQWERGRLPVDGRLRFLSPAPVLDLPQGSVTKIGEMRSEGKRTIRLRLATGGGDAVQLRFDSAAPVVAMGQPGRLLPMPKGEEPFVLRCSGRACDGMTVEVEMASNAPVDAKLLTTRFSLPIEARPLLERIPGDTHPQYGPHASTLVTPIAI